MDWYRIKHTMAMYMTGNAAKRAQYIKKHNIFKHMGNNCMTMFRKIPLYPKLISFGNNVWTASGVLFVTHDVIHQMLNNLPSGGNFTESIGCIDIKDNVFIGSDTTILYNVTIGPNVIVGAGSLVNKSIENEGVYAGVPAKYICSLDEFIKKRKKIPEIKIAHGKYGLSDETVKACWNRFFEMQKRSKESN